MAVQSAHVQDFQSIEDVTVEFGDFTVLVGPSSSGKSAFLRAVKACARNSSVPSNVRQGTPRSAVAVRFEDALVQIERGKSVSTYFLNASPFTKSGRTVPDEVAQALRLPLLESLDATFRFQFDKPFLLAETGSLAAQVLGSLTNVTLLHNAVREANRRRQEAVGVHKIREEDAAVLAEKVDGFRTLPARKKVLDRADGLLSTAQALEARIQELARYQGYAEEARTVLAETKPPPLVNTSPARQDAEALNQRLADLESLVSVISSARDALRALIGHQRVQKDLAAQAQQSYDDALVRFGVCPVCGTATA